MERRFYEIASEIDELIKHGSLENLEKVESMFRREGVAEYFFRKALAETDDPFPWLRPVLKKGYFAPERNPKPVHDPDKPESYVVPHWDVVYYLENVAQKNAKEPSEKVTDILLQITDSIINYREDGKRIENFRTDYTILRILSLIPTRLIKPYHIEFIRSALHLWGYITLIPSEIGKAFIPRLIGDKAEELLLQTIDVVLDYKKDNRKYQPLMDQYWLSSALEEHKSKIAELCGVKAANIALRKMESILSEDQEHFTVYQIRTIEPDPQETFPYDYETQLVCFVRDVFDLIEADQIRDKVRELIGEKHPIFRRIAVYSINRHYKALSKLFWNWPGNPLQDSNAQHEIYELLKSNCHLFSEEQIKLILEWIESRKYHVSSQIRGKKEREEIVALRKREWLTALLDSGNLKVSAKYKEYEKINPYELEHPGYLIWTEFSSGNVSPLELSELFSKANADIATYISNFVEDRYDIRAPTRDGLSDTLRTCAATYPEKFAMDLGPFRNVDMMYQSDIFAGLCEAWRQGKSFEWTEILDFVFELIKQKPFWEWEKPDRSRDYQGWVISAIADLIKEGVKRDNHAFDPKHLPNAEKILLTLLNRKKSDLTMEKDILTAALNTSKGKIFSALINYSLRVARLQKKPKGQRWVAVVKKEFDKRLDRECDPALEFSVTLGEYLHHLFYLDEIWVKSNINRIFPKDNESHWRAAFAGYLFYTRTIYKEVYFLLRKEGHYNKAIATQFADRHSDKQYVQHIVIGFLEDWEKLDDPGSLLSELLRNKKTEQLSEMINFLWRIRDDLTDEKKEKVRPLWKAMVSLLQQVQHDPEYQNVITQMPMFLALFDTIDKEILEWLKFSAKCALAGYHLSNLIESLVEHVQKTPRYVAQIYLGILENGIFPEYPRKQIEQVAETLYQKGEKGAADKICDMYGEKGFYFLRDIYEEYRKNGDQ